MLRAGSSHRDKGPDSILPKSQIVNEEGVDKVRKLMVLEGQRETSVVRLASIPPVTDRLERIIVFVSFVAARWAAPEGQATGTPQVAGYPRAAQRPPAARRRPAAGVPRVAGVPRAAGRRPAVGLPQAAAIRPVEEAPPAAEWQPQGTRESAPCMFVPQPSSSSSPPWQRPLAGGAKEGGRGGQSSSAESATEARSRVGKPEDQGRRGGSTVSAQAGLPSETGSATEARSRAQEPEDQGRRDGSTASAQASPPLETGSTVTPQRPEGQSPPPKRRRADFGLKPQGPEFKILESRWQYRGPKSAPPKDAAGDQRRPEPPRLALAPEPSSPAEPEPQAPPCPEPRAAAAPEQPAPVEPAPSTSRVGQMAAVRAAEPLLDVLGSSREVIERLEAAVARERSQLEVDRATLVEEKGHLEEVGRLLEARITLARANHGIEKRSVAEEREALEELRRRKPPAWGRYRGGGPRSCSPGSGWCVLRMRPSCRSRRLWRPPEQT
ncbi:uncharacterized protein LOC133923785 [Phragmites australis]|uniref:uncharacterized protein LOC133923785 n=1 Tax=Phragmites australis TaxID=29695 RepID=UPI002D7A073A|nr:uncharacterized protein LOC133923785 [Phragmites australis]